MGKPRDSGAERWKNPEIRKAAFLVSEAIEDLYFYGQDEISNEDDFLKLNERYSPSLSKLGLSFSSYYEADKSDTYRPIHFMLEDTKKFIDYLSFIESTDDPSFLTDLNYIFPDIEIWFSDQMVKADQEKSIPEEAALDFLLSMDTILGKLEAIEKKWGSTNPDQDIKLDIRKLKTLIKFRSEKSLNEFFNILSSPIDFEEIEKFNENPESFIKSTVEGYPDFESFNFFLAEKVSLLDSILEKENLTPEYENVFNYIYSFLDRLSSEPGLDSYSISKLEGELEDRREDLERLIEERK
jgi:hypothetical protein